MNKIFKGKKIKVFKTLDDNNLGSLARIILSSFFVIFAFYSLPIIINFTNNEILKNVEFRNNSKTVLAYALDQQNSENIDKK